MTYRFVSNDPGVNCPAPVAPATNPLAITETGEIAGSGTTLSLTTERSFNDALDAGYQTLRRQAVGTWSLTFYAASSISSGSLRVIVERRNSACGVATAIIDETVTITTGTNAYTVSATAEEIVFSADDDLITVRFIYVSGIALSLKIGGTAANNADTRLTIPDDLGGFYALDEAVIALRSAIVTDEFFLELMTAASVFTEQIREAPTLPAMTILVTNDGPQTEIDGINIWRPDIEIAVMGPDKDVLRQIIAVLDGRFTIPESQPQQITSANLRISRLRRTGAQDIAPVQLLDSDQHLQLIVTFWAAKVQPR